MKKIRVREYWETVTVNKTAVEILDDNDNIIESTVALRVYGEVLDSGDLREYTKEEALEQFRSSAVINAINYMQSQIDKELEFEEDCICEAYPEYPGLNQSTITFVHSKDLKHRLWFDDDKRTELIIRYREFCESGKYKYYCILLSAKVPDFVNPELLKKGKKFKVLM
jgi:hypothetical protein